MASARSSTANALALLFFVFVGYAHGDDPAGSLWRRVVAQAHREIHEHGKSYALQAGVRLPWREGEFASGEWKCNYFAMNVVYEAGGRVPAVAYGPGYRRLVSNYMFWRGRTLSRAGRAKLAGSHYPLARDLANPQLFVTTMPVVQEGLDAIRAGDLVFMNPPGGALHGHCLVYLGKRDGTRLRCAYVVEDGVTVQYFDVDQPRGYTVRRPRPGR